MTKQLIQQVFAHRIVELKDLCSSFAEHTHTKKKHIEHHGNTKIDLGFETVR